MSNLSGGADHEVECLLPTGLAVVLEADCDNENGPSVPQTVGHSDDTDAGPREGPGTGVFAAFLNANLGCYWNPHLEESLRGLRYAGWLWPGTLLMAGRHIHLDTVRSAWGRRVLRAPRGYRLLRVGKYMIVLVFIWSSIGKLQMAWRLLRTRASATQCTPILDLKYAKKLAQGCSWTKWCT